DCPGGDGRCPGRWSRADRVVGPACGWPGAVPAAGTARLVLPAVRWAAYRARDGHRRPRRGLGDEPVAGGRTSCAGLGMAAMADPQLAGPAAATASPVARARGGSGRAGVRYRPEPARTAGVPRSRLNNRTGAFTWWALCRRPPATAYHGQEAKREADRDGTGRNHPWGPGGPGHPAGVGLPGSAEASRRDTAL